MRHFHGGSKQNNENTPSQRAPLCMKDVVFCAANQCTSVYKGHSQGMQDMLIHRSCTSQMAERKAESKQHFE